MSDREAPLIVSSDVLRPQRVPPGQRQTRKWPVLHAGPTPSIDPVGWRFRLHGAVRAEWTCDYEQFLALPRVRVSADMHCVTRWSLLDNIWEGVSTREVMRRVEPLPAARFALVHCANEFSTNLPLADFLGEDCLFAFRHNGADLTPDHGHPLRLVVPRLYAWKSAKWVLGVELLEEDRPGFWENWENGGYHMRGDPWVVDGGHADGQRFRER